MIRFPKEILVSKLDPSFYSQIKEILLSARNKVYAAADFAMVEAYWHIGKSIVEKQGGEVRAEYGTRLIAELSAKMTLDFGKGFTVANLQNMRLFYLTFPNFYTLCSKLSWSHYRLLMRVESGQARQCYLEECAKAGWSVRQLERQIHSFSMNDCYPVRISAKFRRRFRERHQQNNQKISFVIHHFLIGSGIVQSLPERIKRCLDGLRVVDVMVFFKLNEQVGVAFFRLEYSQFKCSSVSRFIFNVCFCLTSQEEDIDLGKAMERNRKNGIRPADAKGRHGTLSMSALLKMAVR